MTNGLTESANNSKALTRSSLNQRDWLEIIDWIEFHDIAEPMPLIVSDNLPRLVNWLESRLVKADSQAYAVAVRKIMDFMEGAGQKIPNMDKTVKMYENGISDVPADLLMEAVDIAIKEHRFNVIMKPGYLRDMISDKLNKRKIILSKARVLLMKLNTEHRGPNNPLPTTGE